MPESEVRFATSGHAYDDADTTFRLYRHGQASRRAPALMPTRFHYFHFVSLKKYALMFLLIESQSTMMINTPPYRAYIATSLRSRYVTSLIERYGLHAARRYRFATHAIISPPEVMPLQMQRLSFSMLALLL